MAIVAGSYAGAVEVEWHVEMSAARWWADLLHTFAHDVGAIIPEGFDAYARVFHPARGDGRLLSWKEVAAAAGRVAHPEMQFESIATPARSVDRRIAVEPPFDGSLPARELEILCRELAVHTTTPDRCWFAVWDGFGQLHGSPSATTMYVASPADGEPRMAPGPAVEPLVPRSVLDAPRIRTHGRAYLLASGPLTHINAFSSILGDQSPNVWWPDDRAWIVATEIDFCWTYVAGSRAAIDAVLQHAALEALETSPGHHITFDSDHINT